VTSFAYDLDRDESGNWIGALRPRLRVGMAVWSLLVIGWLAIAVATATGFAADLASVDISPGGAAHVSGNDTTKTVHCNDGHNQVIYHSGSPKIVTGGMSNRATSG